MRDHKKGIEAGDRGHPSDLSDGAIEPDEDHRLQGGKQVSGNQKGADCNAISPREFTQEIQIKHGLRLPHFLDQGCPLKTKF